MPYTLVKRIKRKGWPTSSQKYKKAHKRADKIERKRHGNRQFKIVEAIAKKIPRGELAASHSKRGKIRISKKALKGLSKPMRKKVIRSLITHETEEHRLMTKKRSKK